MPPYHVVKERPILFHAEMVRAILSGGKSQTRRPITNIGGIKEFLINTQSSSFVSTQEYLSSPNLLAYITLGHLAKECPYGIPGDLLWVKETWALAPRGFVYKADFSGNEGSEVIDFNSGDTCPLTWKSSLFMPKNVSRLWLKIIYCSVERIQDISETDIENEGIPIFDPQGMACEFIALWDKYNLKRGFGFNTNPWVWVIEFKKLEKER